jgi:cyclophilin family peptidyl-prolyl cis-trans isomerase
MRSLTPKIIIFAIILFAIARCSDTQEIIIKKNNFSSPEYRSIFDNLQTNNTDSLIEILKTANPQLKTADIYAIASIGDSMYNTVIAPFLNNDNAQIRIASAFALGQMKSNFYESKLIAQYNNENDNFVKKQILISLGKTGSDKALNFVASLNIDNKNTQILQGQGIAFYFFSKRKIISEQMFAKTFEILNNENISQDAKLYFSYTLTLNNLQFNNNYFSIIENEIKTQDNIYLLTNLTLSLKNIHTTQSFKLLTEILQATTDYRIKIAAIKALEAFYYESGKKYIFKALTDQNPQIAIVASEYFVKKGTRNDANTYLSYIKKISSWKARSNMLMAALKYSPDKKNIANSIISGYNAAENIYEKASLLYALSVDPKQYAFVNDQTFSTNEKIISTTGMKCLMQMRINPHFNKIAATIKSNSNEDINAKFKIIVQEAMAKGDPAMIYYAAKLINSPDVKLIDVFTNTYFLTQAMNSIKLPKDFTAYNELCKAVNNFGGQNCKKNIAIDNLKLDWNFIAQIPAEQRVLVKTNKGNFEITLDVNSNPANVYIFLQLVNNGYYNNTFFANENPGKAIFTGGKRGDGWQNLNIPLIKEISNKNFIDGSVVMPTITQNYNSVNWFITTSPTIEYYGNNTIIGQVTKGLYIVHQLEIGDKIFEIRML